MTAVVDVAPLSHAQQRLLLAEQMLPGAAEHFLVSAYHLRGPLQVEPLRQALSDVAQRHPVLRAVYGWDDDLTPHQRVLASAPDDLLEVMPAPEPAQAEEPAEGRGAQADPAGQVAQAERVARSLYASWWDQPFDLEQRPPVRARLVRLSPDRHVLCYAVHQIAFDEWSAQVFLADLRTAYAARAAGRPPGWEPAPSYLEYPQWESSQLPGWRERDLEYWRRALHDFPAPLLPAPGSPEGPAGTYTTEVPPAVVRGFTARCGRLGHLPLGILLCTAAEALNQEYAAPRLNLGTLFSGRVRARYRPVIGCFVNPVVVPVDLAAGATFLDRLGAVTRTMLDCLGHAHTPHDEVVRVLRSPELPLPWYQVLAFLFDQPREAAVAGDVEFQRLSVQPPRTSLELVLEGVPRTDGGWWLRGRWRNDLVPEATGRGIVAAMATGLHRLAG